MERQLTFFVKKLVLDIAANLRVEPTRGGTPVDTGWARSNWLVRIKDPPTSPVGTRPEKKGDAGVDEGASDASVAEFATGYVINAGNVYISNLVPYIAQLNSGTSKQAPEGFVERAILKAIVEDSQR
jgi:hypothetical protein